MEGLGSKQSNVRDAIEKMKDGVADLDDVIIVFRDQDEEASPTETEKGLVLIGEKQNSLGSIRETEHENIETERRKKEVVSRKLFTCNRIPYRTFQTWTMKSKSSQNL